MNTRQEEKSYESIQSPFTNPLPGSDEWKVCSLGPADSWPVELQAYVRTVASFKYPATLFWGDELILLYNEAWAKAGGIKAQGQKQRGFLHPDSWKALQSAMFGGRPRQLASRELLRDDRHDDEHYHVLISPLFSQGQDGVSGLLAQMLPQTEQAPGQPISRPGVTSQDSFGSGKLDQAFKKYGSIDSGKVPHKPGSPVDNVPLDEHPFFHRFSEMLPTGLAILDRDAQAVFVNQKFYEITTHRGPSNKFESWPESIYTEDKKRVLDAYAEAFKSQRQLRTEFRASSEDLPWRLLLLTPLGDENLQHVSLREFGGFICCVIDITSEKHAELTERKAAAEATERKKVQEKFMDMISHEIRNPLSAVLHCAEDIQEAISAPDKLDVVAISEALGIINLCINHQKNIVDDVLAFSKLDATMLTLGPKVCRPSVYLSSPVKMFQPEFRKQGLAIEYIIDTTYVECSVDVVIADLSRIGQVLINLLSNAIKFTARSEGEKSIRVSVGATLSKPASYPHDIVFFKSEEVYPMDGTNTTSWGTGNTVYIMVAVKDSGIGISEEGQRELFGRFRQATPKTEEIYGGSGLGLSISKKICNLHGGEIGVSSKEGSGSTFAFFFKCKKTDREADYELKPEDDAIAKGKAQETIRQLRNVRPDDTPRQRELDFPVRSKEGTDPQPALPAAPPPTRPRSQTHVLLVEDNLINQRIVARKLEATGFNVTIANNGREAVEAVEAVKTAPTASNGEKGSFNIILMDQEMPVLDGNSATRAIRELQSNGEVARLPIVGVSANTRKEQTDEMRSNGMDDVVSKPYRIDELVAKIDYYTGGQSD